MKTTIKKQNSNLKKAVGVLLDNREKLYPLDSQTIEYLEILQGLISTQLNLSVNRDGR